MKRGVLTTKHVGGLRASLLTESIHAPQRSPNPTDNAGRAVCGIPRTPLAAALPSRPAQTPPFLWHRTGCIPKPEKRRQLPSINDTPRQTASLVAAQYAVGDSGLQECS